MNVESIQEYLDEGERDQLSRLLRQAEWGKKFSVICHLISDYEDETGETLVLTSKGMKRSKRSSSMK